MTTVVSVDLDDVACYHEVHGLGEPPADRRGAILERALPRFLALFDQLGVRATFFVIGRDLEADLASGGRGAAQLRAALDAGHELGNHSFSHAYDLANWESRRIYADLRRCDDLLRSIGAAPRGFRAPGYGHDERMLMQVAALGYSYDSSSLPSPPYYAAKLGAMAWMRLRGRRSSSRADNARAFLGSASPHFMPTSGLWEVPMSASPGLRLPLIGTTLLGGPEPLRRVLVRQAEVLSYFHLELHGMDLADPESDGLSHLVGVSPGLGVRLEERKTRLAALLEARGGGQTIFSALHA